MAAGLIVALAAGGAQAAAEIEERFKTELGETMRCVFRSADPAIDPATLTLWLALRYPFESFDFPLVGAGGAPGSEAFARRARAELARQRRAIARLRQAGEGEGRGREAITPLLRAVMGLFEREHVASAALLELAERRDPQRFAAALGRRFRLAPPEVERLERLARAALDARSAGELRTLRDQFLSAYVMVDADGRHFTDFHRDFMRRYGIAPDCRCVADC